jgi:hypothetical protein
MRRLSVRGGLRLFSDTITHESPAYVRNPDMCFVICATMVLNVKYFTYLCHNMKLKNTFYL